MLELVNECGNRDADIILKTDQGPAVKFLVSDALKMRTGAKRMVEESPKKSSGSNGMAERAEPFRNAREKFEASRAGLRDIL